MAMFCEYEVTLSMRPLMVTFGAGAWANARGAARATRAKAIIRTAKVVLFMRLSSNRWMTCDAATCPDRLIPAIRATTVRLETRVLFSVTPSGEKNGKTPHLFTANRFQ